MLIPSRVTRNLNLQKVNKEKLSGGLARAAQLLFSLFFSIIAIFIGLIVYFNGVNIEQVVFFIVIILFNTFLIYWVYKYADIYLTNDLLYQKRLFNSISRSIRDIKNVDRAIMPFTYLIIVKDNSKVFFFSKEDRLIGEAFNGGTNEYLIWLKKKLNLTPNKAV